MIDENKLLELMADLESAGVERTISVNDTAKVCEAICAFANDLSGSRQPGFLLIGVDDRTGLATGLQVTDQLLQNLAGLGADGNILPAPALLAYKIILSSGRGILQSSRCIHPTFHRCVIKGWCESVAALERESPMKTKNGFWRSGGLPECYRLMRSLAKGVYFQTLRWTSSLRATVHLQWTPR